MPKESPKRRKQAGKQTVQKGHPLIAQPSTQSTPHADCTVYLTGVKYLKPKAVDGETLQRARVALGFSLSGVKDTENFGGFNLRFLAHEAIEATHADQPQRNPWNFLRLHPGHSEKQPDNTPPAEDELSLLGVPACNPPNPQAEYLDAVEYNIKKALDVNPAIKAHEIEVSGVEWSKDLEGKKVRGSKVEFSIENAPGVFEVVLRNQHKATIPRLYYILLELTRRPKETSATMTSPRTSARTVASTSTSAQAQVETSPSALERHFDFQISLQEGRALTAESRRSPFYKRASGDGRRTSDRIKKDYSNKHAIRTLVEEGELGLTHALRTMKPHYFRNEIESANQQLETSDKVGMDTSRVEGSSRRREKNRKR